MPSKLPTGEYEPAVLVLRAPRVPCRVSPTVKIGMTSNPLSPVSMAGSVVMAPNVPVKAVAVPTARLTLTAAAEPEKSAVGMAFLATARLGREPRLKNQSRFAQLHFNIGRVGLGAKAGASSSGLSLSH